MPGMDEAWLIPAIPAAAFAFLFFFRNLLPRQGDFIALGALGAAFVVFLLVLIDVLEDATLGEHITPSVEGFTWLEFSDFQIRIGFFVDELAIVMLSVVTFVSLMVVVYSLGYMKGESHYGWYFTVLCLFASSMLTLVLSDNLLLVYITWELVGVCSFLLIGFYFERRSAAEAAKKAFVTTRVGDTAFLIGVILAWHQAGTFDIQEILRLAETGAISDGWLTAISLLIFVGCMGKSAQFPLHVWLPDAMEGPTPVSALIHAATMVVAGVYLTARLLPMFEVAPSVMDVVLVVGVITTVMSALIGLLQTDVKRVVAYSTLNSLGLMFVALGSGGHGLTAALLYLFVHAFFKALLFMAAGSVLHATARQDAMELGGLWRKMPLTAGLFAIGALAMAGIIPLSGFWAKDEILLVLLDERGPVLFGLILASVLLTGIYVARIWILTFLGKPRDQHVYDHAHESGVLMLLPMLALGGLTLIGGFIVFTDIGQLVGLPGGFGEFLYSHDEPVEFHFDYAMAAASAGAAAAGIIIAFYFWHPTGPRAARVEAVFPEITRTIRRKFYIDEVYQAGINHVMMGAAGLIAWFDRAVINDTGVDGGGWLAKFAGERLKYQQSGLVPNYALYIVVGFVALAAIGLLTVTS
ncbi:MAG: NADH-quinone oxidoreductase subunit L [Dehalococcoidia bacterium]|nr:NADH-quinone oxidoreductase subunit L [Dehalococcoidia bacterium]